MLNRHLTDFEIQSYLDGENPENKSFLVNHLNNCVSCRKELKRYKLIFEELNREPDYKLNLGFSGAVITRLNTIENESSISRFDKVIYISGIVISLIIGWYFLDMKYLSSAMAGTFTPIIGLVGNTLLKCLELLNKTGGSFNILLLGLLLVAVYFADNLLLKFKGNRFCL